MSDRYESMLIMKISTELSKDLIVKLSIIVKNKDMEESKSVDDEFLKEVLDFTLGDVHQGFYLHPFSVVDGDNEKLDPLLEKMD